uniref:Uncharacterized protein n=1 Tax=Molossus molossus TaxID=27622 RepID=A0A7J8BM76_MOLMO|nr:hypothetical protein HJG59_010108 [Molossus molossus]
MRPSEVSVATFPPVVGTCSVDEDEANREERKHILPAERHRLEHHRLEHLRLEHLRLERHRLEHLRLEHLRLEHHRLEHLRLEHLRLEHHRLEHLRLEHHRLEHLRLEHHRLEHLRLEHLRLERHRLEHHRLEHPRERLRSIPNPDSHSSPPKNLDLLLSPPPSPPQQHPNSLSSASFIFLLHTVSPSSQELPPPGTHFSPSLPFELPTEGISPPRDPVLVRSGLDNTLLSHPPHAQLCKGVRGRLR